MKSLLFLLLAYVSCSAALGQRIQTKDQAGQTFSTDLVLPSNPIKILRGYNVGTALNDSFDEIYVMPGNGVFPETTEYAAETVMSGDTSFQPTLSSTFETNGDQGSMNMFHFAYITGADSPGAMITPGISIGGACREEVHFDIFETSVIDIEATALGFSAAGNETFMSTHIHRSDWVVQNLQTGELVANRTTYDTNEDFGQSVTLSPGRYTLYALSNFVESYEDGFIDRNTYPCLRTTINWNVTPVGGIGPHNPDTVLPMLSIR